MDKSDPHYNSNTLIMGELSPPMVKKLNVKTSSSREIEKKLECYLFQGYYEDFLKKHPNVLSNVNQKLNPDVCLIPEPGLHVYFSCWINTLCEIMANQIPLIFTCFSCTELKTHDSAIIEKIINAMNGNIVMPLKENRFAVKLIPKTSNPPLPIWDSDNSCNKFYNGPTSKNAFSCTVIGFSNKNAKKSYNKEDIEELKAKLINSGVKILDENQE